MMAMTKMMMTMMVGSSSGLASIYPLWSLLALIEGDTLLLLRHPTAIQPNNNNNNKDRDAPSKLFFILLHYLALIGSALYKSKDPW